MAPKHIEPAKGALAGMKADAQRAKTAALLGEEYKPAVPGVGAAWSHNFLNQKPWHPLNFRNQMKVFEAQEQAEKEAKAKAQGKAEFDAEQEYLKTLSYLSPEDQQKYTERQGVSFMYQKPPGYDAAMSKAAEQSKAEAGEGAASEAANSEQQQDQQAHQTSQRQPRQELPKNYVANMLGAIGALQKHEKYEVRHVSGVGQRSPPRGGVDPQAANQQLLVDDDNDDEPPASAAAGHASEGVSRDEEKRQKRRKLEEAEAFLRAAGVELPIGAAHKKSKHKEKDKDKQKKHKKQKRSKDGTKE